MRNTPSVPEEPPCSPSGGRKLHPIPAGPALEIVGVLDGIRPGFLAEFLRMKPVSKHAVLAVLARSIGPSIEVAREEQITGEAEGLRRIADFCLETKPREMIEGAYGSCPDGVLGAFARIDDPVGWADYVRLIEVFSDPSQTLRHQVLRHSPKLDRARLHGLLKLEPALCVPRLTRKLRTLDDANLGNDALTLVRSHRNDLTDEAVREFVGQGDPMAPFAAQIERLLSLVEDLGPPPLRVPENFIYLRTRSEFREFGLHHRNCLLSKFDSEALTGRAAYLVYRTRPAIAVLVAVQGGWFLGRVHSPGNTPPALSLVEEVRSKLAHAGIPFLAPAPVTGPQGSVRRLLMKWDPFGVSDDEFEGWTAGLD